MMVALKGACPSFCSKQWQRHRQQVAASDQQASSKQAAGKQQAVSNKQTSSKQATKQAAGKQAASSKQQAASSKQQEQSTISKGTGYMGYRLVSGVGYHAVFKRC